MVLYKVNTDLMYNYSCYHVDCHRFANLEKTFLIRKIVTKFQMLSMNGLALTKKGQIRSKEIALQASRLTDLHF